MDNINYKNEIKDVLANNKFAVVETGTGMKAAELLEAEFKNNGVNFIVDAFNPTPNAVSQEERKDIILNHLKEKNATHILVETKMSKENMELYKDLAENNNVKIVFRVPSIKHNDINEIKSFNSIDGALENTKLKQQELDGLKKQQEVFQQENIVSKVTNKETFLERLKKFIVGEPKSNMENNEHNVVKRGLRK